MIIIKEVSSAMSFRKFCLHFSALVLTGALFGCAQSTKGAKHEASSQHKVSSQAEQFSSPAEAVSTLQQAVQAGDKNALLRIFGPESEPLLNSGDAVADREKISDFSQSLTEKQSLEEQPNGEYILLVGKNESPFAIPVVPAGKRWKFDTLEGKEEILNRRIGENELKTIRVSRTYVEAQKEYFQKDRNANGVREYAQKMASTAGKTDGLFWHSTSPSDLSPLGPFAAEAAADGYKRKENEPVPYHGYYFKILTTQGEQAPGGQTSYLNKRGQMTKGFGLVAYPARYGTSGIMTFIVNQDGTVYEKDFGLETLAAVNQMQHFNPDSSWQPVDDPGEELAAE